MHRFYINHRNGADIPVAERLMVRASGAFLRGGLARQRDGVYIFLPFPVRSSPTFCGCPFNLLHLCVDTNMVRYSSKVCGAWQHYFSSFVVISQVAFNHAFNQQYEQFRK